MNFGKIFLVKCLLLLFPSVKCSVVSWVYKAVNETAFLSIAAPGSIYEATWKKDGQRLIVTKDNKSKYYVNKDQCRCRMLQNGTLVINQVVKEDTGNYTVMVYQQDGKLKAEEETMFFVQEPVPQPTLHARCENKTIFVKCEVDQKAKDEELTIELTQPNGRKIQKNASMLELQTRHSGTFRCVVKNQVSEKTTQKVTKCPGRLDLHLILITAGGAIFLIIFVIWLTYCIRKKRKRCEGDDEERMMQTLPAEREKAVRELPTPACALTPRQLRVQQRPLPQPHRQQHHHPPPPQPQEQQHQHHPPPQPQEHHPPPQPQGQHHHHPPPQSHGQHPPPPQPQGKHHPPPPQPQGQHHPPPPQPQGQQQHHHPQPPRPRPRTQPRTPHHPKERA